MANMASSNTDDYTHEDPNIFYTETNIPGPGVNHELLEVSLHVECLCEDICTETCACVAYSGGRMNYTNNLLKFEKLTSSSVILECNESCKCSSQCGNRLVQFGPRKDLSVFKSDLKGYGLKTDVLINKGSFICEYAGELIDREEAKRRALNDSSNYIFVLKEHSCGSILETVVDPTRIGNIGRYINHSCEPNSAILPVRIDSPIPRLAIFALTDIKPGDEVTYDYCSGGFGVGTSPCFCGVARCRGFLPYEKDLLC